MKCRFQTVLAVAFSVFLVACNDSETAPKMHRVTFWATSDSEPVPEVKIYFGKQEIGATNRRGMLRLDVPGEDGQRFPIFAQCPSGYRPADGTQTLQLVTFASDHPRHREFGVEMKIECPPLHRLAAVVIRAGELVNVPVLRNGREIARTDSSGVAHIGFNAQPDERFQFELDTSAREYRHVRPQNPKTPLWKMPDGNELFVWDMDLDFARVRTRVRTVRVRPPETKLPTRVNGRRAW